MRHEVREERSTGRDVELVSPKTLNFDPASAETLDCIFPHILGWHTRESDEKWIIQVQINRFSSLPVRMAISVVRRRYASSQQVFVVSELTIRDQGFVMKRPMM